MLFMIEKPRPTAAERGYAVLSWAVHAVPDALDAVVMGPFRAMERRLENRRLLDTMSAMSDHDLRDIGLCRGDIRDALAVPVGSDGSLFLAARRDARRRGR